MKRLCFFLILFTCLLLAGCKKDTYSGTVVMDCTGSYLRFDNKDYQVCNLEKLTGFSHGDNVIASFERIAGCPAEAEWTSCLMLHKNEGWITITSIKAN